MLNDDDILWLIDIAKSAARGRRDLPVDVTAAEVNERLITIMARLDRPVEPLELLIFCPVCKRQHIDVGDFATTPHKRHACQGCGLLFSVTKDVPNIGVRFFRGCRDSDHAVTFTPVGNPSIAPGSIPAGASLNISLAGTIEASSNPGAARVGNKVTVVLNYKGYW